MPKPLTSPMSRVLAISDQAEELLDMPERELAEWLAENGSNGQAAVRSIDGAIRVLQQVKQALERKRSGA